MLDQHPPVMCLLLVMNVVTLFVEIVMNMSEKKAINLVLNAKLDTKGSEVSYLVFMCLIYYYMSRF